MKIFYLFACFLFSIILTGCWATQFSQSTPDEFSDKDLLNSLIGQKREEIIETLGLPDKTLSEGDREFMLYIGKSSGTDVAFFVWIPVAVESSEEMRLGCLRFTINSDDIVEDYRIESGRWRSFVTHGSDPYMKCMSFFWPVYQNRGFSNVLTERNIGREKLYKREAENGDHKAQFYLYRLLVDFKPEEALMWLCKSADQGNLDATYTLARILEYGRDDQRLHSRTIVESDYIQAYVWYARAAKRYYWEYDEKKLQNYVKKRLGKAELRQAKNASNHWQPGECVNKLLFIKST